MFIVIQIVKCCNEMKGTSQFDRTFTLILRNNYLQSMYIYENWNVYHGPRQRGYNLSWELHV